MNYSRGNKANNELKFKLLKIAASSDSGAEHSGALSRTAKLVLAASGGGKNPASHGAQTPDSVKRGLYSSHLDKKYGPEVMLVTVYSSLQNGNILDLFRSLLTT